MTSLQLSARAPVPARIFCLMALMLTTLQTHASQATPQLLLPDSSAENTLTKSNPRNFNDGSHYRLYRTALKAGQVAMFEVTGELNSYLSLFAPDGKLLAHAPNENKATALYRYDGELTWKVAESGTYTLAVGGNSSQSLGAYRLALKTLELDDVDPLVPGATIKGWLQGYKAVHRLHVDTIGKYRIRFGSKDFSAYLQVDQGGYYKAIDSGAQPDEKLDVFFNAAGDYDIIISPSDKRWRKGLYTLEVELLPCCQVKAP